MAQLTDTAPASATEPTEGDGHKHLPVMGPKVGEPKRLLTLRWAVVAMAVVAVGCYALAYFLPWWEVTLFAPQYPNGLGLQISLRGLGGDVHEIDMLNHYIGMAHLEEAAKLETRIGAYAVGALCVAVLAFATMLGRKLSAAMTIAGLLFPVGFVADSFYWLHRFGHHLDPHAPIHLPPFTPQLFGEGKIGQFSTIAAPLEGFWVAIAGTLLLAVAGVIRHRICAACARKGSCGLTCPTAFVGPRSGMPAPESEEAKG